MNQLWAPWRSAYIYSRKRKGCIFCGARNKAQDKTRYIFARTAHSFAILNRYPYNNGHVMIAPFKHAKSLEYLKADELADLLALVNRVKAMLDRRVKPSGYNIGINIGKIAGAGFQGHLHIHIVPRWPGDTNFMPVLGKTKVISDSLKAMHKLLAR